MPKKDLKPGFTTGAAASAAVKAALLTLLTGRSPESVRMFFLSGGFRDVDVHQVRQVSEACCEAGIIKDAGDDPDITHRAEIRARVCLVHGDPGEVIIRGGRGVGKVTQPGLELPVGEPAINPGPRRMIREAVRAVYGQTGRRPQHQVTVEIMVPEGEKLARKTLNARLGIEGGISILGTTGIVRPLSHGAYIATIRSSVSVAAAKDIRTLVFTTGRRSERFAMGLFPRVPQEAFIQTGDFFKAGIEAALSRHTIREIVYTVFFGKAVKMALGYAHTHAAKSELTLKSLAEWAEEITADTILSQNIARANTARHAFSYIYPDYPAVLSRVGEKMVEKAGLFADDKIEIRAIILNFNGRVAYDSSEG